MRNVSVNIPMQCLPLWNILNVYKEWMGTSWPFAQLQEAIRTAKVFESCSGLAMRLKRFRQEFTEQFGIMHCQLNGKVWGQHFNAVRAPLNHSEYLQGMNGVQADNTCAVARSNQNRQSCWELQWVGLAPQAFPCKICGNSLEWMQHFNLVRAPLKHSEYLQGMSGNQLTICAVARSNQNG